MQNCRLQLNNYEQLIRVQIRVYVVYTYVQASLTRKRNWKQENAIRSLFNCFAGQLKYKYIRIGIYKRNTVKKYEQKFLLFLCGTVTKATVFCFHHFVSLFCTIYFFSCFFLLFLIEGGFISLPCAIYHQTKLHCTTK